jgi:glutamate formiminotransferase / formiminotetrahydrofolate cyclodeaminase
LRKLVECIPNFSEGRNPEVIEQIVAAIKTISGAVLLDHESDADHNRSVITFVAAPDVVVDAAIAAAKKAAELIDLNHHTGEHPRMGATDVIPFVPIADVTMDDCVQLARACGERMWKELGIPVYLYEKAATRPERENLAAVRKGQFEGIRNEIATSEARRPDFGEPRVHPTAGITAVGARPPLIAYNVNLATPNIEIANKIARAVRHLSGGLRYVKALGFELKDRGIVQVSMNMVNYEGTPLFRVFEMIKREAERYGVAVVGSEIVGLVPQGALNGVADFYLQLENFSKAQILEERLAATLAETSAAPTSPASSDAATANRDTATAMVAATPSIDSEPGAEPRSPRAVVLSLADSLGLFPDLVAAGTPTPGGGSVAAQSGVMAASLGQMVCNLTIGKPKFADREARVKVIRDELEQLGLRLRELIAEDSASFEAVMRAFRLPKETEDQKRERTAQIQAATLGAALVPMETAERAFAVLQHLSELAETGNPNALSDAGVGAQLAQAAIKGAAYNVRANLGSLADRNAAARLGEQVARLIDEAKALADAIEAKMEM